MTYFSLDASVLTSEVLFLISPPRRALPPRPLATPPPLLLGPSAVWVDLKEASCLLSQLITFSFDLFT